VSLGRCEKSICLKTNCQNLSLPGRASLEAAGAGCLNFHDLQVVDSDPSGTGLKPNYKKKLPFGFSLSAEAYRIFAFFYFG
jgi:hypothetical protein